MSGTRSAEPGQGGPSGAVAWLRSWRDPAAWSLRRRVVLSTSGVVAIVAVLLVSVFGLLLERASVVAVDRELAGRADRLVAAVSVDPASGRVQVAQDALGAGDAVVTPRGEPVAGVLDEVARQALPELLPRLRATASGTSATEVEVELEADDEASDRVLARAVTVADRRLVVVVDQPLDAYEQSQQLAVLAGSLLGLLAVLGSGAVAAWTTRRALRPVGRMATSAGEWSRHDLDLRFGSGPRQTADEIGHLAETLDDLLDRVAEVIREEQRLTAELAHELRTPLTGLRGTLDLLRLREDLDTDAHGDLEEVHRAAERMDATITTLLALARTGPAVGHRGATVAEVLDAAAVPAGHVVGALPDVRVRGDRRAVAGALAPLVDNARRHAVARWWVEVAVDRDASRVVLAVCDDGAGFLVGTEVEALAPGWSSVGGTGLGLSLAHRLAAGVGGEVVVTAGGPATGTRVELRVPQDRA